MIIKETSLLVPRQLSSTLLITMWMKKSVYKETVEMPN